MMILDWEINLYPCFRWQAKKAVDSIQNVQADLGHIYPHIQRKNQ